MVGSISNFIFGSNDYIGLSYINMIDSLSVGGIPEMGTRIVMLVIILIVLAITILLVFTIKQNNDKA